MPARTILSCCIRGGLSRCFNSFCATLVEREADKQALDGEAKGDRAYQAKVLDVLLKELEQFSKN